MNPKTLTILGIATVATVVVAAFTLHKSESSVDAVQDQTKLFPNLEASINDVASVNVKRSDGEYTLQRNGDEWGLADKGNYAIEMEAVRKLLIGVADMTTIEIKTSDPARYEALGVQDIGAPDATPPADSNATGVTKPTLLTFKDKDGKELAKLIVGKDHDVKGSFDRTQRYVRKSGDASAWLVNAKIELKDKGTDWLQKKILEVKRDRVRSVEVAQPEGELLVVDRAVPEQNDFTLVDVPEGKELIYPTAPGSLANGLEYVNLDDVEPAGRIDFTQTPGPTAKFKTFDGLVVTVQTKDQDGKTYARFTPSYEAPPAAPEKPAEPKKEGDKPDDKKPAAAKKSPEEVQKEVADLEARLSKWTYVISSYNRATFAKKKSELVKDKAPPPPPPADPNAPKADAPKDGAEPKKDGETYYIPSDLPPEIQQQIKASQEAMGHKTAIGPPRKKPGDALPGDPANKPADGTTPAPTTPKDEPKADDKPAATPPH